MYATFINGERKKTPKARIDAVTISPKLLHA